MKDKYIVSSSSNGLPDELKVIQSTIRKFIAPNGIASTLDLFNIGNQFITIQIKDERFNSCKITINKDEWDKVVKSISDEDNSNNNILYAKYPKLMAKHRAKFNTANEDQMLVDDNTSSTGEKSKSIANHSNTRNSIAIKSIEDIREEIAKEYCQYQFSNTSNNYWEKLVGTASSSTLTKCCDKVAELYAKQFKTN